MKLKLTRRRFGQLAITSTTVAGLGYLANKTFAQTRPPLVIYGASPSPKGGKIILQSLNVETSKVQDVTTATLDVGEKLIGLTSLANGTLVLAVGPVRAGKKENAPTRLIFLGKSPKTLTVSGLDRQQYALESLLSLNDGSLIGLVIRKNNMPPVRLVDIDLNTGEVSFTGRVNLPAQERFSQLMQTPNGTIYTTVVGQLKTSLMRLDLAQRRVSNLALLNFKGKVWSNGLNDMVSSPASPANELFALGASRYVSPNNLYVVNPGTGAMTLLKEKWDVTKITTLRA